MPTIFLRQDLTDIIDHGHVDKVAPASAFIRQKGSLVVILLYFACAQTEAALDLYRVTSLPLAFTRFADPTRMTHGTVVAIVDGDTIKAIIAEPRFELKEQETIRFIGVDTPEVVDPRKPVQRFGKEASSFTSERLLGTAIYLAFDRELRDYYGRLLAYIFLENGTCFNLTIIENGFGFAYVKYPFRFMEEFRAAELKARYGKKGLWGP